MHDFVIRAYQRLPAPLRNVAATLQGYRLRAWRYGPESERLIGEALERETWSADRWLSWQQERLSFVLHRAATRVPYYREQWAARRRKGDRTGWEKLDAWPILDKEAVRQHPRAFVADDCDVRGMYHDHTSGTTGKPLDVWLSRDTLRAHYALFEARCRRWNGVSWGERWGMSGGQLIIPTEQRRPPFWVWNSALNQLYLSSYHLAPDLIPYYLDAMRRYRLTHLVGYSSSLNALAQAAPRGVQPPQLRVVVTNAEPLFDYQREAIQTAFQCPVKQTYGMAEIITAASECQHGSLHIHPEKGILEILDDTQAPVPPGQPGELVCTGLLNADMPLVRYRNGDRLVLAPPGATCSCGRTLPMLAGVEGRSDDVLYTSDGRVIGRLDPVFKSNLPIREAQIIQESLAQVRLRYVAAPGFSDETAQLLITRLKDRMGNISVRLESVPSIPREPNGKFRAVVCRISPSPPRSSRSTTVLS